MKKSPFVLLCLLGLVTLSQAQSLIFKAGGSLANVGSIIEPKNKPGVVAGLALEIPLSARFSVQPELLFHQKGFKFEGSIEVMGALDYIGTYDFEYSYTLNYAELPVLVKYKIGIFYINAGPSISYGIGGHYSIRRFNHDQDFDVTQKGNVKFGSSSFENQSDDVHHIDNALDLGLQVGGGIKIFKRIIIDARYGFGLSNPYDKSDLVSFKKEKSHNRSFQLTVGYPIKLGKK